MNLINTISAIILFQLGLLSLFLFTSRQGKKLSNRILASFFVWLALNIADGLLTISGFYERFPSLAHLEDGFILLVGPILYFYTQSIVYKDFQFRRNDAIHLLPFFIITAIFQIIYRSQTPQYQQMIESAIARQTLPVGYYFSIAVVYAQITAYMVASLKLVSSYRQQIKEVFSSVSRVNLDWLVFMLSSIAVIFVVSVVYTFLPATGLRTLFEQTIFVPFIFIFVFTNLVVWKGLKQPEIFSGIEREEKKYMGSGLTEIEKLTIRQSLEEHLHKHKPYLNPDLTINQLADALKVPAKRLSQVINETYGQNFFDLINTMRIEEACRIFSEDKDPGLTVLEVMYQCGFNSKSSFNTVFRKKTGVTPGLFRKNALASPA